mgnify:CR=1 FL=1
MVDKNNLIFDIGYNKGEFAQECIRRFPNCKVIGVEANLSLVYGIPDTPNLKIINALVSSEDNKEVDFYIEPYQPGISTASKDFIENSRFTKGSKYLRPNSSNWMEPVKARTITLDMMIVEFGSPDYIKIDVEGYECEVLKGLTQKQKTICFEWREEAPEEVYKAVKHLQKLGYEKFGIIGIFEEGDVFKKFTYSSKGDPYLEEPDQYFSWDELDFDSLINPDRRVNYGMMFVK